MKQIILAAAATMLVMPGVAFADPPRHAPAHGYFKKRSVEPIYKDTRIWRGDDGRYYCRRSDGTTGLIIGAAGGAILGLKIERSNYRCR